MRNKYVKDFDRLVPKTSLISDPQTTPELRGWWDMKTGATEIWTTSTSTDAKGELMDKLARKVKVLPN